MSEEKMMPCPACGSENILWENVDAVICIDCYTQGPTAPDNELAIKAWNALPRALRWTKESPTKDGWYWWKDARVGEVFVAWVFTVLRTYARLLDGNDNDYEIEKLDGEWAGPIPEPKEK